MKSKKYLQTIIIYVVSLLSITILAAGCSREEKSGGTGESETSSFDIGVYIPGVRDGSPIYEQLSDGVDRVAAENSNVTVKVVEAGFNQGEWEEKMISMAATGDYELIVSSNGAIPHIAAAAAEKFPDQKFLVMDSILPGHPRIATVLYNQVEQAYMVGYLGGLITTSDMSGATPVKKIGLVVGQQYNAMDNMIAPGYLEGARAVDSEISVDMRVLGNWYDGNKAAELANSMIDAGVDVILTVCGGANQGVIKAAEERGVYVLYLDSDAYELAPGVIVGCSVLDQERAVYEKVSAALKGALEWGSAEILDTESGYVEFIDSSPFYADSLPESIRNRMAGMLGDIRSGKLTLEVPVYWE